MKITEALSSNAVFGKLFEVPKTWARWRVFLKCLYGEKLAKHELTVFREHTGRRTPRKGGYPEACLITGRQSGKSRIASIIAVFEALRAKRKPGEPSPVALLVAQDF